MYLQRSTLRITILVEEVSRQAGIIPNVREKVEVMGLGTLRQAEQCGEAIGLLSDLTHSKQTKLKVCGHQHY